MAQETGLPTQARQKAREGTEAWAQGGFSIALCAKGLEKALVTQKVGLGAQLPLPQTPGPKAPPLPSAFGDKPVLEGISQLLPSLSIKSAGNMEPICQRPL